VPSQSEDSAQQDRPLIELEVVRYDEPHAGGRPLFLNARRFIRICHVIERGESASEACRQQLTTYRNFRMHVARNPKYQRRLRQAEEVREHFLREFHIANITKHSLKNVVASMFWLERRYPNEFALRTVIRDAVKRKPGRSLTRSRLSNWSKTPSLRPRSPPTLRLDLRENSSR
jgi:hypothetical protein